MKKVAVATERAPKSIGPYSQAVSAGGFVFVSGQIPVEPSTGEIPPGGIKEQTRQVIRNIEAVLKAAGAGLSDVVKTTVFLSDISMFPEMNGVYAEFFKEPYPARATVEVSALPRGVLVEIDATAAAG